MLGLCLFVVICVIVVFGVYGFKGFEFGVVIF